MRRWPLTLMYHRVVERLDAPDPTGNTITAHALESQLRWLLSHRYACVPPAAIAASADRRKDAQALPRLAFSITFDDGYRDNYLLAWPILRRLGLPATVFLVTDCVGGVNGFDRAASPHPVAMLTEREIREMHASGIEFGSHTCTHPDDLTRLAARDVERELVESRRRVEAILDAPCTAFAYPHGKHDARTEAAVAEAGYAYACAAVGTRIDRYALSRLDAARWSGATLRLAMLEREVKWRARQSPLKGLLAAGR